jgi:hypothetical protein
MPKLCLVPSTSCDAPDYDGWFKDVLAGRTKRFYPHRIRLLEIPGTVLLVYHTHKQAIVGEARIVRTTFEDGMHNYWFEKFLLYPDPVRPEMLHTAPRLVKLSGRAQWKVIYLSETTLEEIRKLSGLKLKTREELRREAGSAKQEVERYGFSLQGLGTFSVPEERKKLLCRGLDPQVLDKAEEIFLQVSKKKLVKRRSQKAVFSVCLYLAYRYCHIPTKPRLFQKIGDIDLKKFESTLKSFLRELKLHLPSIGPEEWINYYSGNLGISDETIHLALELLGGIKNKRILGYKSPSAIAATALYLACLRAKEDITQKNIANAYGVSELTLRNQARLWQT